MELKFLKEGTTKEEEDGIEIEFGEISSSLQSLLITMGAVRTSAGKAALTTYLLKNVITKLTVDGKEYDPYQVGQRSDLSDPDTVVTFFKIARLVMSSIVIGYEIKKKSEEQPSHLEKEETAPDAQKVKEEALPKPV